MSEKNVTTVQKLDGSKIEVALTAGDSLKSVLERAKAYDTSKFTYMISGPEIDGGQKQVDEALIDSVTVESTEQVLVIPKTIAG